MAQLEIQETTLDGNVSVLRDSAGIARTNDCWLYEGANLAFAEDRFAHLKPIKPREGSPLASDLIMEERGPR